MSKRNGALMHLPKKRDAFTAIKRFLNYEDVELKVEEHAILQRWEYCDRLLFAKELDEQGIIDQLVKMFEISTFTARNDIYYTQRIFADARKIQKKYLLHHHIDSIARDRQMIRKAFFVEGDNGTAFQGDSKDIMALSKLNDSYTYALNSIPEDAVDEKQPPPVFQFILAPGQIIDRPLEIEDAIKSADEIIMKQNDQGVFTADEPVQ
jgi:hypothetical protein